MAWGYDAITTYESESGRALMRGEWKHDKAVGSVYWDARGRSLVSTSYDDKLRGEWASLLYDDAERVITYTLTQPSVWDFKSSVFKTEGQFPSMRPLRVIPHNCQTVRLTFPLALIKGILEQSSLPPFLALSAHEHNANSSSGPLAYPPPRALDGEPGRLPALHDWKHAPLA